ncbi:MULTISPECIES: membrane protein [Streptomyces]|uniref:Membrane protein n=1 Tax=Streptomyces viridochromogenes TaxID=1938 RepID=A0A0L8JEP2_STRVR|nr:MULTISPECIES: membrane protein [Streptomyces]KOG12125.1 membrane protein [Streptomyces viridochromogenes]
MTSEHASPQLISAYLRSPQALATDKVWALEGHLEGCPTCRDHLSALARVQDPAVMSLLDDVWAGLEPQLTATASAPRRRSAGLFSWAAPTTVPWLLAIIVVSFLATLLDVLQSLTGDISLLLLLAPLLPVLAVTAAWSPALDPASEITAATPRAGMPLVLRRTVATLAVVVPTLLIGGWATGAMVAQWLLPCLATTAATLALGTVWGVTRAALALSGLWAGVILVPALAMSHMPLALRPSALPVWAALAALATMALIVRRNTGALLHPQR